MKGTDENSWENALSIILLRSRGAESRKKILEALLSEAKSCNQLVREIKLNWRTANWHLKILIKENLVRSVSFGQRNFYKLTPKGEETILKLRRQQKGNLEKTKKTSQSDHFSK